MEAGNTYWGGSLADSPYKSQHQVMRAICKNNAAKLNCTFQQHLRGASSLSYLIALEDINIFDGAVDDDDDEDEVVCRVLRGEESEHENSDGDVSDQEAEVQFKLPAISFTKSEEPTQLLGKKMLAWMKQCFGELLNTQYFFLYD